jgi:hypothetical protein
MHGSCATALQSHMAAALAALVPNARTSRMNRPRDVAGQKVAEYHQQPSATLGLLRPDYEDGTRPHHSRPVGRHIAQAEHILNNIRLSCIFIGDLIATAYVYSFAFNIPHHLINTTDFGEVITASTDLPRAVC